jgi:hypothetical protein
MAEPARKVDDVSAPKAPGNSGEGEGPGGKKVLGVLELVNQSKAKAKLKMSGPQGQSGNFRPGFKAKLTVRSKPGSGQGAGSSAGPEAQKSVDGIKSSDESEDADPENELNPDREPEEENEGENKDGKENADAGAEENDPNKKVEPDAEEDKEKDKDKNKKKEGGGADKEDDSAEPADGQNPDNQPGNQKEQPDVEAGQGQDKPRYQGPPEDPEQGNKANAGSSKSKDGQESAPENQPAGNQPAEQQTAQPESNAAEGQDNQAAKGPMKSKKELQQEVEIQAGKQFVTWSYGFMSTIVLIPVAMLLLDGYMIIGMFSDKVFWHQLSKWQIFLLGLLHFVLFSLVILLIWAVLNYTCTGFTGFVIKNVLSHFSDSLKFCTELDKAGLLIKFN